MHDSTTSIEQFLTATAARQPTPGGGSVAALAGALSSAIGEMVLNYSVGKRGLENVQDQLKPVLAELTKARQLFLQLMTEDQLAYEALTAAKKSNDASARDVALLASIRIPQAMAATALAILDLCDRVADIVNHYLLSDLAVCADLAMATLRCALYNVRANLPDVSDPQEKSKLTRSADEMLARGISTIQRVSPRIWRRAQVS
jgi:formiminotetrahydrofolate cyclodeaminase